MKLFLFNLVLCTTSGCRVWLETHSSWLQFDFFFSSITCEFYSGSGFCVCLWSIEQAGATPSMMILRPMTCTITAGWAPFLFSNVYYKDFREQMFSFRTNLFKIWFEPILFHLRCCLFRILLLGFCWGCSWFWWSARANVPYPSCKSATLLSLTVCDDILVLFFLVEVWELVLTNFLLRFGSLMASWVCHFYSI